MSNQSISQSPASHNQISYLESRLSYFSALANNALSASWRQFWQSQVEYFREQLKAKPVESEARDA